MKRTVSLALLYSGMSLFSPHIHAEESEEASTSEAVAEASSTEVTSVAETSENSEDSFTADADLAKAKAKSKSRKSSSKQAKANRVDDADAVASVRPRLGQLTYFPAQYHFLSDTSFTLLSTKWNFDNPSAFGNSSGDVKSTSYIFNEALTYTFLPKHLVGASLDYSNEKTTASVSTPLGSGESETKSAGFSNPIFMYDFRLKNQNEWPLNLDLILTYSPSLIEKKSSSTNHNGTVSSGRHIVVFKPQISANANRLVWSLAPALTYNGETTSKDQTTDKNDKTDAYLSFGLSAGAQYYFVPAIALDLGLSYDYYPKRHSTSGTTGVGSDTSAFNEFGAKVGANATLVPEKLNVYANYQAALASEFTAGTTKFKNLTAHVLNLGVKVLF